LLLLFLGSTIGNFEPDAAVEFLTALRAWMCPGDGLLLGTDLVKPVDRLLAAYDDAAGVTAAFNLNLLARINRELDADFNVRHFHHEARYRPEEQRIEMHLRSRARQTVRIGKAGISAEFGAGETILTEVCHKFRAEQIAGMARTAGFQLERQWIDEPWGFAESLLRV
jgi:L-histidine Nalpha-methyltransferase